jgi:lipopolysaccharide transport system permease protein
MIINTNFAYYTIMKTMKENSMSGWDTVISSKPSFFKLELKEIWRYRDLIFIFVKRDIISIYKQTILGPIWFLFGPLFTVFTYTFIFGEIAKISTDGLPGPLFYISGTLLWNYFQGCFNGTSTVFSANASVFGKVYFPRLVVPISLILSNLLKLGLQFLTYLFFYFYYRFSGNYDFISLNKTILFIPVIILILATLGLGLGLIVSSMTSKYRDLTMIIGVVMTLVMYASPIMYPSSSIPEIYKPYLSLNPISPLIEAFRYAFTSTGEFQFSGLVYSVLFTIIVLVLGIFVFNKTEKTFMDTI